MKRSNEPRLPMASVWPRMDRLAIKTDQIMIELQGKSDDSPSSENFAQFRQEIISILAVFLHDRFYSTDPVEFLKELHLINAKTNKFSEHLKNTSSAVLAAVSVKDDELLAAHGGKLEPLVERIIADLAILSGHLTALVQEESAQGRLLDRPSVNLVRALADLYREVTGKATTYGNSSYTAKTASTGFGRFVDQTMCALSEAIRLNPNESIRKMGDTTLRPSVEAVVRLVCSSAEMPSKMD